MRGEVAPACEAHENCLNLLSGSADISDWSRGSQGKKRLCWVKRLLIKEIMRLIVWTHVVHGQTRQ